MGNQVQVSGRHLFGVLAFHGDLRVEFCSVGPSSEANTGEQLWQIGVRLQRRFAHDRRRCVDRLYAFRVRQGLQPQRRHRAIGAVGHRRVDAGGLLRRRLDGHRRVTAGQGQQLILIQFETVGVLERRQRIRPLDEFRRGRQRTCRRR